MTQVVTKFYKDEHEADQRIFELKLTRKGLNAVRQIARHYSGTAQTTTMRLTSRSKLQGDCMRIHYFYREPSGQQMIDEDTKRFGFQPGELLALVDRFAPPSSGLES